MYGDGDADESSNEYEVDGDDGDVGDLAVPGRLDPPF